MSQVAISGIGGFVGGALKEYLQGLGFKVVGIDRTLLRDSDKLTQIVEQSDIIINLSGANIIHRWTKEYKKTLYSSRIETTKAIIEAISKASSKPSLLISTSAVGIYDDSKIQDEDDHILANDFLANLCKKWEQEALQAQKSGVRVAIFRFGIVLGLGGALQKMLLPFKLGLGGVIGSGKQALSFIHIDDLLRAYKRMIEDSSAKGIYNLVAPQPTTNEGMTVALGKALHRPTILPVPEFVLRAIFGEGAQVLTDGQKVVPKRLLQSGFSFEYDTIEKAIDSLVK